MANTPPVQTFYTPFPENQVLKALDTINSEAASPVDTYVSIAAIADGTIIYYDQWEDGYEGDISNPGKSTTQIWGDGNPANGSAPGLIGDVIKAGNVIVLKQPNINVATLQSVIDFDGRDKFGATKTVAVTRAAWADVTNTLLASALEVYDTNNWGTSYRVPVGENLPTTGGPNLGNDNDMFEYTGLVIMASKNGTVVNIDADGNGTAETKVTLAEGESYLVNGGVNSGATVNSSNPVQVDLITGDRGARFESRSFTLAPTSQWGNSYYTPVGTSSTDPTYVFLYNPGPTNITIQWETAGGVQRGFTLEPGKTKRREVPNNSGSHFFSTGNFYALATVDSDADNNLTHEWGNTLIPQNRLTSQVLIGLGLGRDPTSTVNPKENSAPVWVTPVGNGGSAVDIYVDYNGDGIGALTDPNGFKYDRLVQLKELENARIYDPDGDQTGMLLYVLKPGVKLAAAWGQDPSTASGAQPALDLGTTIPPLPEFAAGKNGVLFDNPNTPGVDGDKDGNGVISPGDTLLYIINILNTSRVPVPNVRLTDPIPVDTTYVPNTVQIDYGDGQGFRAIKDDSSGTPFPLDGSGLNLNSDITTGVEPGAIPPKGQFTVTFQVQIDDLANLTPGTDTIINNAVVSALGTDLKISDDTPLNFNNGPKPLIQIENFINGQDADTPPGVNVTVGDSLNLTYVVTNNSNTALSNVVVRDDNGTPGNTSDDFTPTFTGGDTNGNSQLDLNETWTYAASRTALLGQQTRLATVTGKLKNKLPGTVSDDDPANYFGQQVISPASVGNRVWNDLNSNGLQDAGELGVPGVTVTLTGGGPDGKISTGGNNTTATATTDANGLYQFTNLNPGEEYQLTFTLPTNNYVGFTKSKVGSDGTIDSDVVNPNAGTTPIFTLSGGQVNNDLDAGLTQNPPILTNFLNVIFAIDVSGSTDTIFTPTSPTFPVGDQSGNGDPNTVLDAELAAVKLLNQYLVAQGFGNIAKVSIVWFNDSSGNIDMDPVTGGVQLSTTPSALLVDNNNDGTPDLFAATFKDFPTGGTLFQPALQKSIDTLNALNTPNGQGNVILISDGTSDENPNSFANLVNEIENIRGQNLRAFVASTDTSPNLSVYDYIDSISNNTPGVAPFPVQFTNSDQLLAAFSQNLTLG